MAFSSLDDVLEGLMPHLLPAILGDMKMVKDIHLLDEFKRPISLSIVRSKHNALQFICLKVTS